MANGAQVTVNVITITEDALRKIIREEVKRAVEPGAIRPPYLPPYQQPITYPLPQIYCGTSVAKPLEGTVINA